MMGKFFNKIKLLNSAVIISAFLCFFLCLLSSCELFENDVQDYMEKYTETAAIEEHEFSVETYDDDFGNLSFSSFEDAQIEFIMRNPKKFSMIPSVEFPSLDGSISRIPVEIEQTDTETVIMKMPQKFLIPADEGHDLTADISLYEPMSGRTFDIYTVDMRCNTEPPLILNPTVINNGGSTFVIAFEMPNDEEVAIRHKDLSQVEIDGISYPVEVTTTEDSDGIKHAVYNFPDSHFTREWSSAYSIINQKTFTHNANAAYFNTEVPFVAQDREFTVVLRDKAGLTSTVKASTSVSKLNKPVLKDQNGTVISENGMTGIPFNEDTMTGKVTIIPPTQDHLGNTVSGATVHYRVYEATGSGLIYTSGTTTESKTIELPQNTYRVEAYATLLNYENSSTATVKFRFINNILFVKAGAVNGDGSEGAPYATIAEAIADINARPRHETMFSIYAEDDGATKLNEEINLTGNINTDNFTIAKKPNASSATIKSLAMDSSLPSTMVITINGMTIDGSTGAGIQVDTTVPVTLSNVNVLNAGAQGLKLTAGTITANNVTIDSSANKGIEISNSSVQLEATGLSISNSGGHGIDMANGGTLIYTGGTISSNNGSGIYAANGANITYNSGTITANTNNGIYLYDSTLNYYNGTISANSQYGLSIWDSSVNYYNGTISGNTDDGIYMDGGSLSYYGGSVTGNTGNGVAVDGGILTYHNGSVTNHTSTSTSGIVIGNASGHEIKNGTFSGNTCGLTILGASVTVSGGNFTQNGTGINVGNGSLSLTGGSITGSTTAGVTVSTSATINMSGNPYVQNNGPAAAKKNVELAGSKNIAITGALTTGCRVGVYLDDTSRIPTAIGNKNSFTTNYGSLNSSAPSNFFTSDQALAIVPEGSGSAIQAALALAGANGNTSYTAYDYHFGFTSTNNVIVRKGTAKTVSTALTLTRTEPNSSTTSLYLDLTDHKLYDSNTDELDVSCANGATVSVSAGVYNGDVLASDISNTITESSGSLYVTIPAMQNPDNYVVKIYLSFLGQTHETSIDFAVMDILGDHLQPNAVGDIVFSDGTAIRYTADLVLDNQQKAGAVAYIFYAGGNSGLGERILGVGLKQAQKAWTAIGYTADINGTGNINNGTNNTQSVINYAGENLTEDKYPAFWWVVNYGVEVNNDATGWYLPAINELSYVTAKEATINALVNKIGESEAAVRMPTSPYQFWSSTELSDVTAYVVTAGGSGNNTKPTALYVRAIRDFTPSP